MLLWLVNPMKMDFQKGNYVYGFIFNGCCNFRVGCQKYKELYESVGATTLMPEHLQLKPKSIMIHFKGKKGLKIKLKSLILKW